MVLLVSGGHTMLVHMEDHGRYTVVGSTIDDAAGEAFDKVARFLGLGYPGGPVIDRLALQGDREAIRFPRPMASDGTFAFPFSGLKTAVGKQVRKNPDVHAADVSAPSTRAVVEVRGAQGRAVARRAGGRGMSRAGDRGGKRRYDSGR